MSRPWPTGEKLPGFFERPNARPAWLARNMSAWDHLRAKPVPLHRPVKPR